MVFKAGLEFRGDGFNASVVDLENFEQSEVILRAPSINIETLYLPDSESQIQLEYFPHVDIEPHFEFQNILSSSSTAINITVK